MRHIITGTAITVYLDGQTYNMLIGDPRAPALRLALQASDEDKVKSYFVTVLDPLRTFGGHLSDTPVYIKSEAGYWRGPREGITQNKDEAFPYRPSEILSVIGPKDTVEFIRI
jgi:hypothetical protein